MQKTIAVLTSTAAVLVIAIVVVLVFGDKRPRTPDDVIRSLINDEDITDADWEILKRNELERPPLKWSSTEGEWLYQKRDFHDWSMKQSVVPETWLTVSEWLGNDESYHDKPSSLDVIVTNKPTGAQYHITGTRSSSGASCEIKFIGNKNWK